MAGGRKGRKKDEGKEKRGKKDSEKGHLKRKNLPDHLLRGKKRKQAKRERNIINTAPSH